MLMFRGNKTPCHHRKLDGQALHFYAVVCGIPCKNGAAFSTRLELEPAIPKAILEQSLPPYPVVSLGPSNYLVVNF